MISGWYAVQKLMKFGMFLDSRFKKAPYLSDVLRMDVRTDVRNELVKIIRECQTPQDGSSRHAHTNESTCSSTQDGSSRHTHTNDSAQDNDSPSHPKRIKLVNLLGDILDSPTARTKIKRKKIIAEAEIWRYESEPGESLESKRPLEWWRLCTMSGHCK